MSERLTDRAPITAAELSENIILYVVDIDNKVQHQDGSSFQISKEELILALGLEASTQDNKFKKIPFGTVAHNGVSFPLASTINALSDNPSGAYKTIADNELPLFTGIVQPEEDGPVYDSAYVVLGKGKGEYGINGNIVLVNTDLFPIKLNKILEGDPQPPDPLNDPNGYVEDLGEIADGDYLTVINSEPDPFFVIEAGTNWYLTLTHNGAKIILKFVGNNNTYGNGETQMVLADLLIIYDERTEKSNKETFIATAGQTVFNLSTSPNNVDVFVDGIMKSEATYYTYVAGVVTLENGALLGSEIIIRKHH